MFDPAPQPKAGDLRVRGGWLEEYALGVADLPVDTSEAFKETGWYRVVEMPGKRRLRLYAVLFTESDVEVTLAPTERVVCVERFRVEGFAPYNRAWIEQRVDPDEDDLMQAVLNS